MASAGSSKEDRKLQRYRYNSRGQVIGIVDGNENQTGFDLDTWGKLMKIQAADELNFISGTTVMIITMVIIIMF